MKRPAFRFPFFKKKRTPAPMAAEVVPAEEAAASIPAVVPVEEYAEALPYEGGPVNGVQMAEEIAPTLDDIKPGQISTAGYDFYNCKSFDPFIATLDMEERNQFTELFILRFKGTMPEIPTYEVGGDNAEFFRKIFIYLGQYRDRIPSGFDNIEYSKADSVG